MAQSHELRVYGAIYQDEHGHFYKVARVGADILALHAEDRSALHMGRDIRCPACTARQPHTSEMHHNLLAQHARRFLSKRVTDSGVVAIGAHDEAIHGAEPEDEPYYVDFGELPTRSLYGRADAGDGELDDDPGDDYSQLPRRGGR